MIPQHISAAVVDLKAAGWVEPLEAVELTGRSLGEIVRLTESGELGMLTLGPWWQDDVPRTVYLLQVEQLRAAPPRPNLRAV